MLLGVINEQEYDNIRTLSELNSFYPVSDGFRNAGDFDFDESGVNSGSFSFSNLSFYVPNVLFVDSLFVTGSIPASSFSLWSDNDIRSLGVMDGLDLSVSDVETTFNADWKAFDWLYSSPSSRSPLTNQDYQVVMGGVEQFSSGYFNLDGLSTDLLVSAFGFTNPPSPSSVAVSHRWLYNPVYFVSDIQLVLTSPFWYDQPDIIGWISSAMVAPFLSSPPVSPVGAVWPSESLRQSLGTNFVVSNSTRISRSLSVRDSAGLRSVVFGTMSSP